MLWKFKRLQQRSSLLGDFELQKGKKKSKALEWRFLTEIAQNIDNTYKKNDLAVNPHIAAQHPSLG